MTIEELDKLRHLKTEDEEKAYRMAARYIYSSESGDIDIEVDDDAAFSDAREKDGSGGVWVQAWVWVNAEEVKEKEFQP